MIWVLSLYQWLASVFDMLSRSFGNLQSSLAVQASDPLMGRKIPAERAGYVRFDPQVQEPDQGTQGYLSGTAVPA